MTTTLQVSPIGHKTIGYAGQRQPIAGDFWGFHCTEWKIPLALLKPDNNGFVTLRHVEGTNSHVINIVVPQADSHPPHFWLGAAA